MRFLLYEGESSRLNGITCSSKIHTSYTLSCVKKHVSRVLFKVVILLDKRD